MSNYIEVMGFQKFFAAIALLFCFGCKQKEPSKVVTITKAELVTALEQGNIQLLDVRRPEEFQKGHINGAQNLNILDSVTFVEGASKLNKDEPIYIYCQAGMRSKKASAKLKELGFATIFDYSGGYGSWE